MEKKLARVVNRGFAGEPEYIVIQELTTNKVFELSSIVEVTEPNGEVNRVAIENDNLNQPLIQRILGQGHTVDITWNESDEVTCYFY